MYIANIWGIVFCFYIPTLLIIALAYLEGREEGIKYARRNYNSKSKFTK